MLEYAWLSAILQDSSSLPYCNPLRHSLAQVSILNYYFFSS